MNEDDLIDTEYSYDFEVSEEPKRPLLNAKADSSLQLNNGWNKQIENDARIIGEQSGGLRWMHNKAATVFMKRYWITTGINIVLSAIVVAFNAITGAECSTDGFNPYKIVSIVGASLVAVVTTYTSVKNYGARVTAHQVLEGNFLALFNTVKNQLHVNRTDRQFGKDFIEWIQKEYADLSANPDSPNIPTFIIDEYTKTIEGMNIAKYTDIEIIDIKEDSDNNVTPANTKFTNVKPNKPRKRVTSSFNRTRIPSSRKHKNTRTHSEDDNYTVSIPNRSELSAKDKWQLSRFYDNDK